MILVSSKGLGIETVSRGSTPFPSEKAGSDVREFAKFVR